MCANAKVYNHPNTKPHKEADVIFKYSMKYVSCQWFLGTGSFGVSDATGGLDSLCGACVSAGLLADTPALQSYGHRRTAWCLPSGVALPAIILLTSTLRLLVCCA